ncbi:MAG: hypothetical protein K6B13_03320, partial [Prevotella sp.]|nr:hypothetical protein [Prevotella sp.]
MMKKIRLISALLMLLGLSATAQESISVGEVLVPTGRQAMMEVMFHFNEGHSYVSYQFNVNLPSGVSFVQDERGYVPVVLGDGQPASIFSKDMPVSSAIMKAFSNPSTAIGGNEGVLVCIPIQVDQSVEVGRELQGSLTGVEFADITAVSHQFSDVSFTIKVTDKVILDENYTWVPFATDVACDLKVIRTIKANEWSTICLPFDMTEEQAKAVFGNDVKLACSDSYTVEKTTDGSVTGITINFKDDDLSEGFVSNYPYLIKTSKEITEFEMTARVNPEDAKSAFLSNKGKIIGNFIGTNQANTLVPKNSLFINGNKFYYSAGKTKMKAFRAYFTLSEVLSEVAQAGA